MAGNKGKDLVFGVGIYKEGKFNATIKINNIKTNTKVYDAWHDMIRRCYSKKTQAKQPSYIGCSVSDEWIYFQNFAEWYSKNYYKLENERVTLDKDILFKGNKIYSPETCMFVPQSINNFFIKSNVARGSLPIGVSLDNRGYSDGSLKYITCLNINGKQITLGTFRTVEEAFFRYKQEKERLAKTIILPYDGLIPEHTYNKIRTILNDYIVDIND